MASVEPCVWRSTWNEIAGLIFARLHASSIGRNWCDLPHTPPSRSRENRIVSELAGGQCREQPLPFVRQDDMARLACLAVAHRDHAGIGVEIGACIFANSE